MSRIARFSLLGTFVFSTLGFVAIGMFLGPEFPAGATPFYVLAGICGVVAVVVWSPWNATQRDAEFQETEDSDADESPGHSRRSLRPSRHQETAEAEPDEPASCMSSI